MERNRLNDLLEKYKKGIASAKESKELNDWYRETANQPSEFPQDENDTYHEMLNRLKEARSPVRRKISWPKFWAAASVMAFIGAGTFFMLHKNQVPVNQTAMLRSVTPGSNRAILTLNNGQKISLTDAQNGKLTDQKGVTITKAANGQIVYQMNSTSQTNPSAAELAYNTITTPAGGQFQIILPDGSIVWLNAASSIKFPVSFAGLKQRTVELTGEGYFSVKHNEQLPFKVKTHSQVIEDIGTEFNIEAYDDAAAIKTTLVQGAVKVTSGVNHVMLKPGQQAIANNGLRVTQVNTEDVVAWKNGYFQFEDETLDNIMKSISRWYDVRIEFTDDSLKTARYGFVTTRLANISALLKLIEDTGDVHFKLEGTTIIVSKKSK